MIREVRYPLPIELLERRKACGQDRRDEVWEGELHVVPPAHEEHGRLELHLGVFFHLHWESQGLGRVSSEPGVKRPGAGPMIVLGEKVPEDYRVPDLTLLLPERFDRLSDGWIVGGPDVVIEVESPGDESREKLPFYLGVGVREVLLIDRDTRRIELFTASETGWVAVEPTDEGWIRSEVLRTELRTEPPVAPDRPAAVRIRRSDDVSRSLLIP